MPLNKATDNKLPGTLINFHVDSGDLDFTSAKNLAKQKAATLCKDPMLLSWYQGRTGESYPNLECGRDDTPAWILYAVSRNGDISVNINEGEYIFIFLSL
jgi:hypothetical protein